jgi:hypothetical protein
MRVSFDLDDTLICRQAYVPCEPNRVPFFLKIWLKEPLRLGTCKLIQQLKQHKCEIWIYTTSYRSVFMIRLWLLCYGIHINSIINQKIHEKYFKRNSQYKSPSKNPKAFGIDIHIDDSEGVQQEGKMYGFDVIVISPDNLNWSQQILEEVVNRLS